MNKDHDNLLLMYDCCTLCLTNIKISYVTPVHNSRFPKFSKDRDAKSIDSLRASIIISYALDYCTQIGYLE
jgi:hypothetical protein